MQSVLRSFRVLEMISEKQPVGVNELARLCKLPPATTQRILVALAKAGWIRSTGEVSTRWSLTARAMVIGQRAMCGTDLREAATPVMTRLRDQTGETVNLAARDGEHHTILVERKDSNQAVRTYTEIGTVSPLHATATGKAILAALPDSFFERLMADGFTAITEQTIVDPIQLRTEIHRIREVGYAINRGGNRPNVCAIGAVIRDPHGAPFAAISMSMPDLRFDEARVPEWGALVSTAAHEIAEKHGRAEGFPR